MIFAMPLKGSLESIPHLTATDMRISFLIFMKDTLKLDGVRHSARIGRLIQWIVLPIGKKPNLANTEVGNGLSGG